MSLMKNFLNTSKANHAATTAPVKGNPELWEEELTTLDMLKDLGRGINYHWHLVLNMRIQPNPTKIGIDIVVLVDLVVEVDIGNI
ncbi:hypothetical protein FRC12_021530 [Ceratobasidium sp. 428]|nr:hypothetical protein FRC12_021530 [Ceratobasidium sp. 428]